MDMTSTGNEFEVTDLDCIENPDFPGMVYMKASKVLFIVSDVLSSLKNGSPIKEINLEVKNYIGANGKVYFWGTNNQYPNSIIEIARKNAIIPSIIDKFSRAIYGSGLITGTIDEAGKFTPKKFPEFEAFRRLSDPLAYLHRATRDFLYFNQPLPQFTLSNDKTKIVALEAQHSAHLRWEMQDEKTHKINYGYLNAQWNLVPEGDSSTVILPVVHQSYNTVEQIQKLPKNQYICLYKFQTFSELEYYYPAVDWHSVITSGWVDVANDIPRFKQYLMRNLATVNYEIRIKDWYWDRRFKGFKTMDETEKITCRKKVYNELNKFITGIEMTGKSLLVDVWTSAPGYIEDIKKGSSFELVPVDSTDFSGKFNQDVQEANTMIMFAMGLDPSLFGAMPGTERSGGSDKREAYNIWITLIDLYAHIILKPFEIIRDYNGWDADMEFSFGHAILQTLDQVSVKDRQTVNPQ
jgi:hypothetical protein